MSSDFGTGFVLPDTPRTRQWRLKLYLQHKRRSLMLCIERERIRMAFRRLDDFQFYAGTQWKPEEIAKWSPNASA